MGREMEGRFEREGTWVYLLLILTEREGTWVYLWLILTEKTKFCKAIILQLNKIINFLKGHCGTYIQWNITQPLKRMK